MTRRLGALAREVLVVNVDMDAVRQILAWVALAAILTVLWFGRSKTVWWRPKIWALVAIAAIFGVQNVLPRGLGRVQPGARGVLLRFGAPTGRIVPPGVYYVWPLVDTVVQVNTQINTVTFDRAQGICHDLEPVATDVAVSFHVDPGHAVEVYTNFRDDYVRRIVGPAVQDAIKSVTAGFTASELVTKRDEMQRQLRASVGERIAAFGLRLDAIGTTRLQYQYAYAQASQDKVASVQRTFQARQDLQRVRYESQQGVIRAESEIRALKLQRSVSPQLLVQQRKLDLQRRAIDKWDGHLPQSTTSMPFLGGVLGKTD